MNNIIEEIYKSEKKYIIGVDECGYGSWAGSIVVCAVFCDKNWKLDELKDSKKLSFNKRNAISEKLKKENILYSIVECKANKLDSIVLSGKNVGFVLRELYEQAITNLLEETKQDSVIVIDGIHKLKSINHYSVPKADNIFPSVMSASILGKSFRDNEMIRLSEYYPDFNFNKHFGYGTKEHIKAIEKLGICAIHRKTYKPIKEYLKRKFNNE